MINVEKILANRQVKLGNQYFNRGNYQAAHDSYLKSFQHQYTLIALFNYVRLEQFTGNIKEASWAANEAVQNFSKNGNAYILRGEFYKNNHQYVQALSDFGDVSTNNPNVMAHALMGMGECYSELGDTQNAVSGFLAAVKKMKDLSKHSYY